MNEFLICRSCYHVQVTEEKCCRWCCACSWLLVRSFVEFEALMLNTSSVPALLYVLRMLGRINAVNLNEAFENVINRAVAAARYERARADAHKEK